MNLITEQQINKVADGLLKNICAQNISFDSVHSPEKASAKSLVFISSAEMLQLALTNKSVGLIILEKKFADLQKDIPESATIWTTSNIQQAMTRILPLFDRKAEALPVGIHPTSVIHSSAIIGKNVSIAPYAVIGAFAQIKENASIGAHAVIEAHSIIGENTLISPHVVVGLGCQIGSHCIIGSHVTIGSDGFGFYTDRNGHHKIPQIGIVVIEDYCEIGAHTAIDRATLEQTVIKRGSKLDNHCHIAHNVEIGENALLAAAFKTAGSTKFGKNLMTAGNVDINGHIEIADNVILAGRTGVISSITEAGIYGGFPSEPQKDNIKNMASFTHLNKIRKQVQKIMKHLNLQE